MKKLYKIAVSTTPLLLPLVVLAQGDVGTILGNIRTLLNNLIPVLIGIAGIVFLWGVVQFITGAGDEEKRRKGRGLIIYGLIGLAVMLAFWGLVNILLTSFGIERGTPGAIPTVPTIPGN